MMAILVCHGLILEEIWKTIGITWLITMEGGAKSTNGIRNSYASNLHAINTSFPFFSVFTPPQE